MPIFEVQGPDGSTYEIDAPDEGTALSAFQSYSSPQESQQSQDLRSQLSDMTQNPDTADFERRRFDSLPTWQKPIVAASDMGQLAANGATFGFLDKGVALARAPFTGRTYAEELEGQRALTQSARNRAGSAGAAAEIGGSVGTGLGLAGRGATLAGRFGSAGMEGAKGLLARAALMGVEGEGYSALSSAGYDSEYTPGIGLAAGALGNVAAEGITKGVSKVAGAFNKKPVTPSKDELVALKDAAYDAADKAGVVFTPNAVDRIRSKVIIDLTEMGYDPALHPGAKAVLSRIQGLSGQNVTLKGLDTIRKVASNGFIPGEKSNNLAVSKIIGAIDDVTSSPGAKDVLMGDKAGMKALQEARKYASRVAKMETAENLIKKGNIHADRNITDTRVKSVKEQLAKINDPFSGWGRGFNAAEKEAAAKAATYTPAQRALHGASVMNPFGGGKLSAAGHLGAAGVNIASGNLPGLALQAAGAGIGAGLGKAGEALANKSVKEFTDLIARGGILAPTTKNAVQRLAESKSDLIARGILGYALERARNQAPAQ